MARFGGLDEVYFDNSGVPLAGGKLEFFESSTVTQKNTYLEIGETTLNANPVILDAYGRQPDIFFSGQARVKIFTSADVEIDDKDPLPGTYASAVSSTDNALPRWSGTGGTNLQNSLAILDDSGNMSGLVNLNTTGAFTAATGAISDGASGATANTSYDNWVIESAEIGGLSFLSPDNRSMFLNWGSVTNNSSANISVRYQSAGMIIQTLVAGFNVSINGDAGVFNTSFSGASGSEKTEHAGGISLSGASATAGGGIAFPATQVSSADANTIDDYEEGVWTPAPNGTGTITTDSVSGSYTKFGRLVTIIFEINFAAGATGTSSNISGLPYTVKNQDADPVGAARENFNSGDMWQLRGNTNAATMNYSRYDNTLTISGNDVLSGSLTYEV